MQRKVILYYSYQTEKKKGTANPGKLRRRHIVNKSWIQWVRCENLLYKLRYITYPLCQPAAVPPHPALKASPLAACSVILSLASQSWSESAVNHFSTITAVFMLTSVALRDCVESLLGFSQYMLTYVCFYIAVLSPRHLSFIILHFSNMNKLRTLAQFMSSWNLLTVFSLFFFFFFWPFLLINSSSLCHLSHAAYLIITAPAPAELLGIDKMFRSGA